LVDGWPVEKPVRLHFPRKRPGCKDGYLSWAHESSCCFLCLVRKKWREFLQIAEAARSAKRMKRAEEWTPEEMAAEQVRWAKEKGLDYKVFPCGHVACALSGENVSMLEKCPFCSRGSREDQMSLHGVYEEMRDDSWFAAGVRGKKG